MSSTAPPTTIRVAREDEFEAMGKLYASAFADDNITKIIYDKVDPATALQEEWIEGAKAGIVKGHNTILVLERSDTGELIGEACFRLVNQEHPAASPPDSSLGEINKIEYKKMAIPRFAFQRELLDKFGQYIFLQEFCIAPAYQQQGLGKKLMLHVIEVAKKQGLNVALTADGGSEPFYAKLGFREFGDPIMIGPDNTIRGVTKMVLEQFPAGLPVGT